MAEPEQIILSRLKEATTERVKNTLPILFLHPIQILIEAIRVFPDARFVIKVSTHRNNTPIIPSLWPIAVTDKVFPLQILRCRESDAIINLTLARIRDRLTQSRAHRNGFSLH